MFLVIALFELAVYFILAAVVLGVIIGTILGVIKGVWRLYYPPKIGPIFVSVTEDEEEVKPASTTQKAAVAAVSLGVGAYVGTKFGKSIV
jgi:hypothetical protein